MPIVHHHQARVAMRQLEAAANALAETDSRSLTGPTQVSHDEAYASLIAVISSLSDTAARIKPKELKPKELWFRQRMLPEVRVSGDE